MTGRELITSSDNSSVRAARRLLAGPTARAKAGRFLVEGPQAVREALAEPGRVAELFVATGQAAAQEFHAAADATGVPVRLVTPRVLAGLAETRHPQGVVAACHLVTSHGIPSHLGAASLVVALDRVQDPGNAGTAIRTADAVAADAILLSAGSVDPHNGKCVRASVGSIFHTPIHVGVDLTDAAADARAAGMAVAAASADGEIELGSAACHVVLARPTMWVFGNEAGGLAPEVRAAADVTVRVPIPGRAESLNLATAVAVCLYESVHVRAGHRDHRPSVSTA